MKQTKILLVFLSLGLILTLSACERGKSVCPLEDTPRPTLVLADLLLTPAPELDSSPVQVEIKGKMTLVDQMVNYPICNDHWSGVVYVTCDAQVADAALDDEDNPLFFLGCDLTIEPNTVVYVAAHNDSAYYKGCSCHTGEDPPY